LDNLGRADRGKALEGMALVLLRDGRLAVRVGCTPGFAIPGAPDAATSPLSFPVLVIGREEFPPSANASWVMGCCPCSVDMGDDLELGGRTIRLGSQCVFSIEPRTGVKLRGGLESIKTSCEIYRGSE